MYVWTSFSFSAEEQPTIPQEDVFMEPVPGQGHDDDGDLNVVVLGRRMDSTSGAESEHIEDSVNAENQGRLKNNEFWILFIWK